MGATYSVQSKRSAIPKTVTGLGWVLLVGLLSASAPQAIPGGKIAFLRLTSIYWQVWIMEADGSSARQLTTSAVDKVHTAWRPGTTDLLYHTNRGETFVIDLGTGGERRILKDVSTRDSVWSPDGSRLAFSLSPRHDHQGKHTVWITLADGSRRSRLNGEQDSSPNPVWMDAETVLVSRATMLPSMEEKYDFWLLPIDGKSEPRLIGGDDEPKKLDATVSSAEALAYRSLRSGYYEIWTLDGNGEPRQLSRLDAYAGNPSWSPDGRALVFDSDASGRCQVYRIAADGTGLVQLTEGEVPSRKPEWVGPR